MLDLIPVIYQMKWYINFLFPFFSFAQWLQWRTVLIQRLFSHILSTWTSFSRRYNFSSQILVPIFTYKRLGGRKVSTKYTDTLFYWIKTKFPSLYFINFLWYPKIRIASHNSKPSSVYQCVVNSYSSVLWVTCEAVMGVEFIHCWCCYDRRWLTVLWSTQAKVEGNVRRAAWQWVEVAVSLTILLENQAALLCL
jgi:hypothetical protein